MSPTRRTSNARPKHLSSTLKVITLLLCLTVSAYAQAQEPLTTEIQTPAGLDESSKASLATAQQQPLQKFLGAMIHAPVGTTIAVVECIFTIWLAEFWAVVFYIIPFMVSFKLACIASKITGLVSYYGILSGRDSKEKEEEPFFKVFIAMFSLFVHICSLIWLSGGADESYDMPFWMRCVAALITSCFAGCLIMPLLGVYRLCRAGGHWWIGQSHPEHSDESNEALEKGQATGA